MVQNRTSNKKEKRIAPKAILFDFDGVLADTMHDNFLAWQRSFKERGFSLKEEDYFKLEGMRLTEVAKTLSPIPLTDAEAEEIVKSKESYYAGCHTFRFYPDVLNYIKALKLSGMLIAMVTAARASRLQTSVPKSFLEYFNIIITSENSGRGKPYPDPYQNAAEALNVDIKKCLVVENAPFGIQSAKDAGAHCVAICSTLKPEYLLLADEVLQSFSELKHSQFLKNFLA